MNYFWPAARALRKSPGLSLSVVLLLGFGIGANTALFSVLQAILLKPIPGVQRSADLVRIRRSWNGAPQNNQSYPDYLDLRDQSQTLAGLAAERVIAAHMPGPPAQMVTGAIVSGNYFQVLGVRPSAGRLLAPQDDRTPGAHPLVVLSDRFWRQQYGADPAMLGRTLVLNGSTFTVIGIAAPPFDGVQFGERANFWIPMMMVRAAMTRARDYHWLTERAAGWLTFYGRLKPGVRPETAEAEVNTIARQLAALHPETNSGRTFLVTAPVGMDPGERAALRSLLGLLSAGVCLVLLISCGNVANLLMARAAARTREMAIRLALGADRRTLLAHLLAETVLLGLAGAALGLLLAPWIGTLLRNVWTPQLAQETSGALDLRILGFTLAISLLAVLLCGLAPALHQLRIASQMEAGAVLKAGSPTAGGRSPLRQVWVVAQVALSVALVAAASMVLRSMQRIVAIDPGYQPDGIAMASMDLSVLDYSPDRGTRTFLDLLQRVSATPGVKSATLAKSSPAVDWSDRVILFRQGEAPADTAFPAKSSQAVTADRNIIAPGYFRTLRIPLVAGRDFNLQDRSGTAGVVIVSQSLAEHLWRGQNPIGKQIVVPLPRHPLPAPLEVVGVAADSRYRSVLDAPPLLLYSPLLQNYDSIARLMVAVDGSPAQFAGVLRRIVQENNPDLPVRVSTMRDQIDLSVWRQRAAASLLSLFGVLALALACAGINGVVAYNASRRIREIGIRMALGARQSNVLWEVVGQALKLTAVGIVVGLPLAQWAKPALSGLLYETTPFEPPAFAAVPLLFILIAVAASLRPARRAAATDPVIALRQE